MALDISSYSRINALIDAYTTSETEKLVTPITKKQTFTKDVSTGYSTLSTKLSGLKTELLTLKETGADSTFAARTAASSDSKFVTATATTSAAASSFDIRVNQLAKSDLLVAPEKASDTANAITGTHTFVVKTGDGSGGEFTSNVDVTFTASETNKTMMEKVRDAINFDKAVVTSQAKTAASAYAGGASTMTINLNGTATTLSLTGGGTYEQLVDEAVGQISSNTAFSGITAEKVLNQPNPGDVKLKITVKDSAKYISISHSSGFDLVTDLGIGVTKEKGASGTISASVFSPTSTDSQFSLAAKSTGLDYRITSLLDSGTSTVLTDLGINLGSARPTFDQTTTPDTAGFVYSDITQNNNLLNSKFAFNGLNFQRNSNAVSDLVTGVTFNLKSVMVAADPTVNVAVFNDTENIKSKIESFVSKFNDLYTFLQAKSERNFGEKGIFTSDTHASTLLNFFNSNLSSKVSGIQDGDLAYLAQIGITFSSKTGLSISDSTNFENNLKDKISQVEAIFNSTSGIANLLYDEINPYLGANGYLALSKKDLDDNVSYMEKKITTMKSRIDKKSEGLRKQYESLQSQLVSLNSNATLFGINANVF